MFFTYKLKLFSMFAPNTPFLETVSDFFSLYSHRTETLSRKVWSLISFLGSYPMLNIWTQISCDPKHSKRLTCSTSFATRTITPLVFIYLSRPDPHLQAMRTVLWALNCSRLTTMTTSVKMSRLRRRLRLRRTSLAWRVNWIQLSAGEAILFSPAKRSQKSY